MRWFYFMVGLSFILLSILNWKLCTYNESLTYNKTNINNKYKEYRKSNKKLLILCVGSPRTGSTLLYNILRIMVRDKIDPNYIGYYLDFNANNRFNFTQLRENQIKDTMVNIIKTHSSCKKIYNMFTYKDIIDLDDIHIVSFMSIRDFNDVICSFMSWDEGRITALNGLCKAHINALNCFINKHTNYLISYDMLSNSQNHGTLFEFVGNALNISDVLTKYDYHKITNELKYLKGPTLFRFHEITHLHKHHRKNRSQTCNKNDIETMINSHEYCIKAKQLYQQFFNIHGKYHLLLNQPKQILYLN